jgi:class 3 adenylate cyclase
MTRYRFKRKLATILRSEVVGYSRLMRDDKAGTANTIEADKFRSLKRHLCGRRVRWLNVRLEGTFAWTEKLN